MDTFILNAIVQELQHRICPSRINNIVQPDIYSLEFVLWNRGQEFHLAISVDTRYHYLYLTTNPSGSRQILAFGKFLHHHIKGGEIQMLDKPPLERIVTFDIVKKDIDGRDLKFQLILEVMGRYSNLILINQETGKILESFRHVTAVQSSYRRIAPGAEYVPPPQKEQEALTTIGREDFQQLLKEYAEISEKSPKLRLWKFLIQHVQGLSPLLAKEIEGEQIDTSEEARWERFSRLARAVQTGVYGPTLLIETPEYGKQKPFVLSAVPLDQFSTNPRIQEYPSESMNAAAERYYRILVEHQQYETIKTSLLRPLSARLAKLRKKQEHLTAQKTEIEDADAYKQKGELITANLYQLKKGMSTAEVVDYYHENQMIEIPLDPKFTPSQNAQRYFKRYRKLKQGKDITEQRLLETEQEISYLEEVIFFIEDADTLQELENLRDEMQGIGQLKSSKKAKHRAEQHHDPFLRCISSDSFEIYVGRNSRENDLLTQRTALPEDIWLHVHRAPGSHVLILNRQRNRSVPEQTLIEAASLAAYHSKLRQSGKVDVIYTPKKYVKKPKGSPPGLVRVSQFEILRVTPRAKV